jgi:uncharacterized protein (DUF433 family)
MLNAARPQSRTVPLPTTADPAACDGCTLAPGSLQRVREMAALREQGWSLDEIAVRYRVSRERVRQILIAHGSMDANVAEARRRRAEALAQSRIDDLLARWRSGQDAGRAAAALGLQAAACRSTIERFASEVDRAARRASLAGARGGTGAQIYSDRDILVALTSVAARLARVPSPKEYAGVAREMGFPSLPTVLNRMGGWTSAIKAAGMTPLSQPRRPRTQRWTPDACWAALRVAAEELGEVPSVLAYERHAAKRKDLPSSATVRNRLGRWSTIATRLAAERELVMLQTQPAAQAELA